MDDALETRLRSARRDPSLAVLTGFHAVKHALRFGATIDLLAATDPVALEALRQRLAPDLVLPSVSVISNARLKAAVPRPPATGVVALAARPAPQLGRVLADERQRPLVLLEDPRTMGNMGACVRVAAAAGAAGVVTTGERDPWHDDALRGSAGLHYALPVVRSGGVPVGTGRPLVAFDPGGEPLRPELLPSRAITAFGTERDGCSDALLAAADHVVSLPMEPGVSSLNLATSVAAVLYAWRLGVPLDT